MQLIGTDYVQECTGMGYAYSLQLVRASNPIRMGKHLKCRKEDFEATLHRMQLATQQELAPPTVRKYTKKDRPKAAK